MAVKLRLHRMGKKKSPVYRIVAIDSRKSRDGEYIEQIGFYNPKTEPATIKIDVELTKKWIANGAQPTDTVRDILVNEGIIAGSAKYAKKAEVAEEVNAVDAAVEAAVAKIED